MRSKRILWALAVGFGAAFVYAILTPSRTAAALLPLRLMLLGAMPALSAVCVVAALRWKATARANLLLGLASVVVAMFLAELASPALAYWSARARLPRVPDASFDGRDKLQVVLDLQAQGIPAVPSIEPKGLLLPTPAGKLRSRLEDGGSELQPVGGIAHRPTVVCNETGEWVLYDSDRFGMNNPDNVWDEPIEIAAVGDSFTNGWCAGGDTHYVARLRSRWRQTVNLGQSGNGPLLILASIREYLVDRRPPTVVWFHYEGNDFQDLSAERQSDLLLGYLAPGATQRLSTRQTAIDREVARYVDSAIDEWRGLGDLAIGGFDPSIDFDGLKRWAKLANVRRFFGLNYTFAFSPDHDLFEQVLGTAKRAVDSWGGELLLVYLPSSARYRVIAGANGPWEADRRAVAAIAEDLAVPVIDAHEAFVDNGRPLSLYTPIVGGDYGHFTDAGNDIVASAVLEAIAATGR